MPLEKLKKAKKIAIGTKQVLKAVENNITELIFVAQDADAKVVEPLSTYCNEHGVQIVNVESRIQLGEACGIDVGAAAAAILKD